MGLFDKLSGSRDVTLTPKSALALAAMTMISADGAIEDDEIAILKRVVKGDMDAFEQAYKVYKDRSPLECVEVVSKTLDQRQQLAVIANLLDIGMADGMLAGAEQNLMMSYVNSFQVPEEAIKDIVDVIGVKNDISIFE